MSTCTRWVDRVVITCKNWAQKVDYVCTEWADEGSKDTEGNDEEAKAERLVAAIRLAALSVVDLAGGTARGATGS